MTKIIIQILLVLTLTISVFAQTAEPQENLIDEFGIENSEVIITRLAAAVSHLSKRPDAKIRFRVYGGDENFFALPYHQGTLITAHLNNDRKLSSEKYSIEYCNVNRGSLHIQVFITSQNESLPQCDPILKTPLTTVRFSQIYFPFPKFKLTAIEDSGIATDSPAEGYSRISFGVLKKLLAVAPESKIYLIAYLQADSDIWGIEEGKGRRGKMQSPDKKSIARKMLRDTKKALAENGIETSQIETINGGYINDSRNVKIWFVPKGGEIPKPQTN